MTRQEMKWAKRYLRWAIGTIVLLLLMFFSQFGFWGSPENQEQLKNQPAPSAAEHRLAMGHLGGMRQPDTFYLRRAELRQH